MLCVAGWLRVWGGADCKRPCACVQAQQPSTTTGPVPHHTHPHCPSHAELTHYTCHACDVGLRVRVGCVLAHAHACAPTCQHTAHTIDRPCSVACREDVRITEQKGSPVEPATVVQPSVAPQAVAQPAQAVTMVARPAAAGGVSDEGQAEGVREGSEAVMVQPAARVVHLSAGGVSHAGQAEGLSSREGSELAQAGVVDMQPGGDAGFVKMMMQEGAAGVAFGEPASTEAQASVPAVAQEPQDIGVFRMQPNEVEVDNRKQQQKKKRAQQAMSPTPAPAPPVQRFSEMSTRLQLPPSHTTFPFTQHPAHQKKVRARVPCVLF